jgi:hypothetical protein
MCVCVYIYICMCVCVCIYIYVCVCVCVCVYIYIYIRRKVVSEVLTAVKLVVIAGSEGFPFLCQYNSSFFS